MHPFFIFGSIGCRFDYHARNRRLGDAVAQHQHEMYADEKEYERGHDENMDGEKAAQRCATDRRSTEDKLRQKIADERYPTRLFSSYDDRPRGGLVPAQQLAGESHHDRECEEQHAGRPIHLARILVGAKQKCLRHMRPYHQHHGRRAKVMHPSKEPAERRFVSDELQRLVSLRRG